MAMLISMFSPYSLLQGTALTPEMATHLLLSNVVLLCINAVVSDDFGENSSLLVDTKLCGKL